MEELKIMKKVIIGVIFAILSVFVINAESAPAGATTITESITAGGNYICPSELQIQVMISGGTTDNPVNIYIDGTVTCPAGGTGQRAASSPVFSVKSGTINFIGINEAIIKNSQSQTFNAYGSLQGDATVTVSNIVFDGLNSGTANLLTTGKKSSSTATATFTNCTFQNWSRNSNGVFTCAGASTTTFISCKFLNNIGVGKNTGGLNLNGDSTVILKDCIFDGNSGIQGGSILVSATGTCELENCIIRNSTCQSEETGLGAVYVSGGTLKLKGSTTITTQTKGGNIYLQSGATITIENGWTGSAGITTEAEPASNSPVAITDTTGSNAVLANQLFLDDTSQNYGLRRLSNGTIQIVTHSTSW